MGADVIHHASLVNAGSNHAFDDALPVTSPVTCLFRKSSTNPETLRQTGTHAYFQALRRKNESPEEGPYACTTGSGGQASPKCIAETIDIKIENIHRKTGI
jgi:hypothetical protein